LICYHKSSTKSPLIGLKHKQSFSQKGESYVSANWLEYCNSVTCAHLCFGEQKGETTEREGETTEREGETTEREGETARRATRKMIKPIRGKIGSGEETYRFASLFFLQKNILVFCRISE